MYAGWLSPTRGGPRSIRQSLTFSYQAASACHTIVRTEPTGGMALVRWIKLAAEVKLFLGILFLFFGGSITLRGLVIAINSYKHLYSKTHYFLFQRHSVAASRQLCQSW